MSPYPDTPRGSEVDALEYANEAAEHLFYLAFTGQIAERPYVRCARWLDSIPGVGQYFRLLCMQEFTEEERSYAMWHGAWVMEHGAQRTQYTGPGWQAKQWPKKGKDQRRVKAWR